jgi:hypothetical protein
VVENAALGFVNGKSKLTIALGALIEHSLSALPKAKSRQGTFESRLNYVNDSLVAKNVRL